MSKLQGIPDKEPTRDEVRSYLESMAHQNEVLSRAEAYVQAAAIFRRALALLDEGERDRETLDWLQANGGTITPGGDFRHAVGQWRAAIDQARGA